MPRVSVVIPVYNGENHVKEAIESILCQTYQDFEIIIVDDASKDNSLKKIHELPQDKIKIYQNSINKGIAYSRNKGIEVSRGEYIALLDHDDIAVRNRLECEVMFLDQNQEYEVVGGHHRHIDANGKDLDKQWSVYLNPKYLKAYLLLDNGMVNGSTMFRKDFILRHQIKFRDHMCGAEDYLFWIECSLHGNLKNLDRVLLFWRRTETQETTNMLENHLEERNEALGRARRIALEKTGFKLDSEDFFMINQMFQEECRIGSEDELRRLYTILRKIAVQAVEMNLNNAKEIVTMCRKRFGEKVGKAYFLWEE